jgi:hypothetical protein
MSASRVTFRRAAKLMLKPIMLKPILDQLRFQGPVLKLKGTSGHIETRLGC